MSRGFDIGRILIALALIVQIFAPVASSTSMVRAAFDPLAEASLCVHDETGAPGDDRTIPGAGHHAPCDFCQLASAGGQAPPPSPVAVTMPASVHRDADWRVTVEIVATARLLDHIRGRAPPALS